MFDEVMKQIKKEKVFGSWKDFEFKFEDTVNKNEHIYQLAFAGCKAVQGDTELLPPSIISLYCFLISIILIDDILDNDPRGDYIKIGYGQASNQALAFQAAGFRNLINSEYTDNQKLEMIKVFSNMLFETSYGQCLDVNIPNNEEEFWEMVRTKSSPFYSSLFQIGAIVGNASPEKLSIIKEFGNIYGEMIQIHDDLVDCFEVPASPDWIEGRMPLPILYAQTVKHPDNLILLELRKNIRLNNNLIEAQKILIKCGAVSYCIDQLFLRNKLAKELIENSINIYQGILNDILEKIMEAPKSLINNISRESISN